MNINDLQAVADLASDYLKILRPPRVVIKDTNRGVCHVSYVTVPKWAETYSEAFQIYYVIHEVIHCVVRGHTPRFKALERELLKLWDIIPTYAKCYPRFLHNSAGQELYKSWRQVDRENKQAA